MEFNRSVDKIKINQNVFNKKKSVEKALSSLNHKLPQHPPDTYFIRKNLPMLDRYLDHDEYSELVSKVPQ